MKQEEIFLTEHRELVELYKHNWANIFYLGVSYVVCNGALASLLGIIFASQDLNIINQRVTATFIIFALAFTAYILFMAILERTQKQIMSLVRRALQIEKILQEKSLILDTFSIIEDRRFVKNSKESISKFRLWHKLNIFSGIKIVATLIFVAWIIIITTAVTISM